MGQQLSIWEFQEKPVTVISDSEQEILLTLEEKANTVIDYMLTNYPNLKPSKKDILGSDFENPFYRNSVHFSFKGWEPIKNLNRDFQDAIEELVGMRCVVIRGGNKDVLYISLYFHNHRW